MAGMLRIGPAIDARPAWRAWAVLVLAVLAGLLAMHALAPGGTPSTEEHAAMSSASPTTGMPAARISDGQPADSSCLHSAAPGGGSHKSMDHADGTCAASKTVSGYAPPAPEPGLVVPSDHVSRPGGVAAASLHERAPPDLAELQLLQI